MDLAAHQGAAVAELLEWWEDLHDCSTGSQLARLVVPPSVAVWIGETGDPGAALARLEELLPDRTRVLGPDHPDTLATKAEVESLRNRFF